MTLTKSQIDALVDGLPRAEWDSGVVVLSRGGPDMSVMFAEELARILYLAAGLSATGERKPERVPLVQIIREDGRVEFAPPGSTLPKAKSFEWVRTTPGWFVPDGAE